MLESVTGLNDNYMSVIEYSMLNNMRTMQLSSQSRLASSLYKSEITETIKHQPILFRAFRYLPQSTFIFMVYT